MISYDLSEADYLAAQALHARRHRKLQIFSAAQFLIFFVLGVFLASSPTVNPAYAFGGYMLIVGALVFALLLMLIYLVLNPWQHRRSYRQLKMQTVSRSCDWTDEQFTSHSKYGNSTIPWGDFAKADEDDAVFLLYTSKRQFLCIPKRAFPDPQTVGQFSQLLRTRVKSA